MNGYGYCQCGCGQKTNLAPYTQKSKGWRRGEPYRFIRGHFRRTRTITPDNYKVMPDTGCWAWTGSQNRGGYPQWKQTRAHRAMYLQEVGPIPQGYDLDHLCRNRLCVNPEHLEPVSRRENARRGWLGTRKLTADQARSIYADSRLARIVAADYGVSAETVYNIRAGRCWARVTGVEAGVYVERP